MIDCHLEQRYDWCRTAPAEFHERPAEAPAGPSAETCAHPEVPRAIGTGQACAETAGQGGDAMAGAKTAVQ